MWLYCFLLSLLERFYLLWWENENTVSTHAKHEIVEWRDESRIAGSLCAMKFGKRIYTGKIASVGRLTYFSIHGGSSNSCVIRILQAVKQRC